ncbi:MAG: methyltransferase domain-containing protein [Blastocatellia bacterium]|nr:methyltransferase domain-containing protein [Blastocatellia bacterium]
MSSLSILFRNLGQLFKQDQLQLKDSNAEKFDHAGERLDRVETRLDFAEPRLDATEQRLDIATDRADQAADELIQFRELFSQRLDGLEDRFNTRLEEYTAALDARIEERFTTIEQGHEARFTSIEIRVDVVAENLEEKTNEFARQVEHRLQDAEAAQVERFQHLDAAVDERLTNYEHAVDARFAEYQSAIDQRIDDRLQQIELRSDERYAALNEMFATQSATHNERFEEHSRALDLRIDDRLSRVERNLDQRIGNFEKGIDQRLFTREKFVDDRLEMSRDDIVAQTDILLQRFDQRMDRFNRAMRLILTARKEGDENLPLSLQQRVEQLTSPSNLDASPNVQLDGALGTNKNLGEQMMEWKQTAEERLTQFTPDEQEIVDYLLSFVDPNEADEVFYVKQHLRRYLATLQRIPPVQKTTARVLELGAHHLHFTPALQKYAGYKQISCANWSDIDAGLTEVRTIKQRQGGDVLSFEVKNFNAERDRFPYPDNHFSLVLCGEMLEHLAHDPIHMLWECNRVLQPDGWLLLTTPNLSCARALEGILCSCQPYLFSQYNLQNSAEHHHREYAPLEVRDALIAAGFTIATLETEDVWSKSNPAILELLRQLKFSDELRGDDIFALARKTSAPVERYPKFLYVEVPTASVPKLKGKPKEKKK